MKRLLDYDALTGTSTYHEYDHSTGITRIEETQDATSVVEYAKRLANDSDYKRKGIKEDWYHFATVPNTVLMQIMKEHHIDFRRKEDLPKLERILQRDYKKLLTVDKI